MDISSFWIFPWQHRFIMKPILQTKPTILKCFPISTLFMSRWIFMFSIRYHIWISIYWIKYEMWISMFLRQILHQVFPKINPNINSSVKYPKGQFTKVCFYRLSIKGAIYYKGSFLSFANDVKTSLEYAHCLPCPNFFKSRIPGGLRIFRACFDIVGKW